ncbi:CRISPR-associated endonuclease Cas2 [Azospirillum sp. RWY-5-1]|uniref:CRISPR-associated endoribonuclease Cas2 n=1 Tax=Azospirillum oleiclasticum TaxID=2735135 RepID=A0ABX2T915_9PROT|nr:CRISPR-associated endonuclease Cas2 [Azospirillum oleiclasticum]NYZ13540.1 CRISPR-associated endonuclease Cas2 [Azospirillum oleiclasticum]NYZ20701.1 CRISPR-associated endonuclease Cas2 [Azospirillum oleiclasticum]
MRDENLYVITYDIADPKRWRKVFRLMEGYGEWLQFSVFQCRLGRRRLTELRTQLETRIKPKEDHVLILDLGPADGVRPRVDSLGRIFEPVVRRPTIV